MANFDSNHVKNVVLLGHTGSGKTTLAESMLFEAGIINRRGSIEDQNTVGDYSDMEHEKGKTLFSKLMNSKWRGFKINILDTPGYDDLSGEIISAMRVADCGLMLLNSRMGVEVGTDIIWQYTNDYKLPMLLAVNHLDNDKSDFDKTIAEAKELPTLQEMEELWLAMLTEMTESGKIAKFDAEVVKLDGGTETLRVTRFGNFHITTENEYLLRNDTTDQLQPLGRDPQAKIHDSVAAYHNASTGEMVGLFLDPTKGNSLLRLNQQRSTLMEYYHQGGTVGYLITVLLAIGLLIALERFLVLSVVGGKIRAQLKNLANPSTDNPLGRILTVYHQNMSADVENLELKLDEAILRETPKVDRGIGLIKLFAAVAPLMGLLGTVIGMILTFQTITLYGTGDPKLMAGDISLALVTTALGLIAALPLIFVHSLVASKAKTVLHVLDEQSAGIVAAHAEKEKA